jgi:two-component system sensor histidine kinase AdeS
MKPDPSLSRQILLSLTAVVVGVTVVVLISLYAFYAMLFQVNPPPEVCTADSWMPTWPEWVFMGLLVLAALLTATIAAARLAKRILTPLNSVADSIRRVAHGELNARAVAGDRSLGETAALVDDFNAMAERLQRTAHELVTWNAAIAHELRTPVTILRGRLQGLAEGVFIPDEAQFRSLLGQVEGLSRLIDDLRVLSLADGGHLNLRIAPVHIAGEIRELAELMGPALRVEGLEIELKLEEMMIVCDIMRIRQVLLALLDNARRYAKPGRVLIETRVSGAWIQISVQDDGPGLKEDLVEHVFDAFQRGNDSRSRESGGSGLGLAVVRAIAEAHGGRASYRHSVHAGAIFEVALPLERGRLSP